MNTIKRLQTVLALLLIGFCSISSFAKDNKSLGDAIAKSVEAIIKEINQETKVLTIDDYPGKIAYNEKTVFLAEGKKVSPSAAIKGVRATITYTESYGAEYPAGSGIRPVSGIASRVVLNVHPEKVQQVPETSKRFLNNNDGTISDTKTKLMWQKKDDGRKRTWKEAQKYVQSLKLAGYNDWRLPSIEEHDDELVMVLMGKKRSEGIADWYWSSDQRVWLPFNYSATHYMIGPAISSGEQKETNRAFVRCVRNLK